MKINKKYLYKYLKLYTSDYKLKDCFFCCHNGYARLATSCAYYPEYYITCLYTPDFDCIEIRVHRNVYDHNFYEVQDTLIGKFGSCSSALYNAAHGWRDLL